MGLIRFLSVYDADCADIFSPEHMYDYDLTFLSSFYRSNNNSYLDNLNTSAHEFAKLVKRSTDYTKPEIPHTVFKYAYEKTYNNRYLGIVVVCPDSKLTHYYKSAIHAAKNFNRNLSPENEMFEIMIIDSKSIGSGPVLMANHLAKEFRQKSISMGELQNYADSVASTSVTYILSNYSTAPHLYKIHKSKVIDISHTAGKESIDSFVETASAAILKADNRYAVSYGCECRCIDSVFQKLSNNFNLNPIYSAQYSLASAQILGSDSFCVHIGNYI